MVQAAIFIIMTVIVTQDSNHGNPENQHSQHKSNYGDGSSCLCQAYMHKSHEDHTMISQSITRRSGRI